MDGFLVRHIEARKKSKWNSGFEDPCYSLLCILPRHYYGFGKFSLIVYASWIIFILLPVDFAQAHGNAICLIM